MLIAAIVVFSNNNSLNGIFTHTGLPAILAIFMSLILCFAGRFLPLDQFSLFFLLLFTFRSSFLMFHLLRCFLSSGNIVLISLSVHNPKKTRRRSNNLSVIGVMCVLIVSSGTIKMTILIPTRQNRVHKKQAQKNTKQEL